MSELNSPGFMNEGVHQKTEEVVLSAPAQELKLSDKATFSELSKQYTFFTPALLMLYGNLPLITWIPPSTKVHSIKKEERKNLAEMLKKLPLTVQGLMGFDRAVVADGGVVLKEIDNKTFRSKIIENLFVTGDLLHINRPSGGYSLQLCWTSGWVAGTWV
jgi:predicted flavoprotein YhiN